MSLQNRQKYETIADYENQSASQSEAKRPKLIGLNKYIIFGLVAISVTFFLMFVVNRETSEEAHRKKMQQIIDKHKKYTKGPQISQTQYKDKKSKLENQKKQEDDQTNLGNDDKKEEQNQNIQDKKDDQKQTKGGVQDNQDKKEEKPLDKNSDEDQSEEINEQEEAKKNKVDPKKNKDEQKQKEKENSSMQEQKKGDPSNDDKKIKDPRKEKMVFFCPDNKQLFKLECLDQCPQGFLSDSYDHVCKPKDISPYQIEMKYYVKNDEQGNDSEKKTENYYQVIKSQSYLKQEQIDYGFFFFNQIENDGFNFLNSNLNGTILNSFLDNTDSIIVALDGAEQFYLENQKEIQDIVIRTIEENPLIKKWYVIGLYDVGSYGSLLTLNKFIDKLNGAVVIDPNFMNMQDNFSNKINFSKYENIDILNVDLQQVQKYQSRDMIIIEKESSIYEQQTSNFCNLTSCNRIRYDNNQFSSIGKVEKIQKLLFSYIEQLISKKKQIQLYNN